MGMLGDKTGEVAFMAMGEDALDTSAMEEKSMLSHRSGRDSKGPKDEESGGNGFSVSSAKVLPAGEPSAADADITETSIHSMAPAPAADDVP